MCKTTCLKLTALLFILSTFCAYAQTKKVVIRGKITDPSNYPIGYAAVQNTSTGEGINSSALGVYSFHTTLPASLEAFAIGYNIAKKQIDKSDKDTIDVDFILTENAAELKPVSITAFHPPQIIKEDANLMDFELQEGKLWLMYAIKGGDKLVVADTGGKQITQLTPNYYFHKDSINQTPHGFLYTTYKDSMQFYSLDNSNHIKIVTTSLQNYKMYSTSLVGFKYPYYYYVSYSAKDAHLDFIYYKKTDNSKKAFYSYTDSKIFRANAESEQTMLAIQQLLYGDKGMNQTGDVNNRFDTLVRSMDFDADDQTMAKLKNDLYLARGKNNGQAELALMDARTLLNASHSDPNAVANELNALQLMHGKVFCLLKVINDSVYIFNFQNNMISVYNADNTFVRQEKFGVSANAAYFNEKDILVDDATHECYFRYKRFYKNYIEKVDLNTGRVTYKTELKSNFINKVRVSGGYAFFSYFNTQDRDNNIAGKTCLYKQRLN